MAQAGYDWEETDLKDVVLEIDFVRQTVKINILDWNLPFGGEGIIIII